MVTEYQKVEIAKALPAGTNNIGYVYFRGEGTPWTALDSTYTTNTNSEYHGTNDYPSVTTIIDVTAVSGTSPTMKVILQIGISASNYVDIAESEVITAAGLYNIPTIPAMAGTTRYRLEIGGINPSFTVAVNAFLRAGSPLQVFPTHGADGAIKIREQGTPTVAIGSALPAGTALIGRTAPPEMKHIELRAVTTAQQASLTPAGGKKIRVYGIHVSMTVTAALTSTLRASVSFGTGGVGTAAKVLWSGRPIAGNDTVCSYTGSINCIGAADETVTLTNTTFSVGAAITRAVIFYVEE